MDLFKQLLPSILLTKEPVIEATNEKDYPPFIVNRALSQHQDCVFFANQMNMLAGLPKILQYQYCLNIIRSKRRPFVPWAKKTVIGNELKAIKTYYGYSDAKALEAIKLLTVEQIETITKRTTIND